MFVGEHGLILWPPLVSLAAFDQILTNGHSYFSLGFKVFICEEKPSDTSLMRYPRGLCESIDENAELSR